MNYIMFIFYLKGCNLQNKNKKEKMTSLRIYIKFFSIIMKFLIYQIKKEDLIQNQIINKLNLLFL